MSTTDTSASWSSWYVTTTELLIHAPFLIDVFLPLQAFDVSNEGPTCCVVIFIIPLNLGLENLI